LSDASVFLYSETERDFTLTVSHPMRVNSNMMVTVDRVGHGEGCIVSSNIDATTTNMTLMLPSLPEYLDESVNITCKKEKYD
jgi:hypothetical protein